MAQRRLDSTVAEQAGITRSQARSLIMEGRVRVDGIAIAKPGHGLRESATVEIEKPRPYVSRGGEKLAHALDVFAIDVAGLEALDVGASTGGFTDALLQRGAASVTAVDVGYGQLDWKLRNDPRVIVMERTNFRTLRDDAFPGGFDLIVVDASFISLRTIAARAVTFLRAGGTMVPLVKPQFEAGRERLGPRGVVRDPEVHGAILREVRLAMNEIGLTVNDLTRSPLMGPAGNREFLMRLSRSGSQIDESRIDAVVAEAHA